MGKLKAETAENYVEAMDQDKVGIQALEIKGYTPSPQAVDRDPKSTSVSSAPIRRTTADDCIL